MERKFNVGDRVRRTSDHNPRVPKGSEGVVVDVHGGHFVMVEYDGLVGRRGSFVHNLELVAEPPKRKFADGDRVRINRWGIENAARSSYAHHGLVEGMTGEVIEAYRYDDVIKVRWDVPRMSERTAVREQALDAVPKHRFAVGDKVRVARLTPTSGHLKSDYVGKEGVVTAVYPDFHPYPYSVYISGKTLFVWSDDELEPSKWSTDVSSFARIDDATIERWATKLEDRCIEGSTINSGDALVMRSCGRTYVYRLERYSDER